MNYRDIAVIIPAYKVTHILKDLLLRIPGSVTHIIVVDDCCPYSSGRIAESVNDERIIVLTNSKNQGVGNAVIKGYKKAMELGAEIIIKMDGDGQMDPAYLDKLIKPILTEEADFTKGNRFMDLRALNAMPRIRLLGNSILSFLLKIASGYWNIIDPTNGYTAIHKGTLEKLNLDTISKRYFFESDLLIHLGILNAVVQDVNIPAIYGNEVSSLRIRKVLFQFPQKIVRGFFKRIFFRYFIYDFNMASLYIILSIPLLIFGIMFGTFEWIDSIVSGEIKSCGTIMLAVLPIIVSFQMLLQAVNIDIASVPRRCISKLR